MTSQIGGKAIVESSIWGTTQCMKFFQFPTEIKIISKKKFKLKFNSVDFTIDFCYQQDLLSILKKFI